MGTNADTETALADFPGVINYSKGAYIMSPAAKNLPGYEGLVGMYRQQPEQQQQARFEQDAELRTNHIEMGHRAKVMVNSEIPPAFFGDWVPDADSGKTTFGSDVT